MAMGFINITLQKLIKLTASFGVIEHGQHKLLFL
jgi:hypothetical protein